MIDLQRTFDALSRWFEQRLIPTDSLTVILNFSDRNAAVLFDMAMQRDLESVVLKTQEKWLDLRSFEVLGIRVKVESPAHEWNDNNA